MEKELEKYVETANSFSKRIDTEKLTDNDFQKPVVLGCLFASNYLSVGRLIQVRKKQSVFGTDTLLIELIDGKLQAYGNVALLQFPPCFENEFNKKYPPNPKFKITNEYSIDNKLPFTGFIMNCV